MSAFNRTGFKDSLITLNRKRRQTAEAVKNHQTLANDQRNNNKLIQKVNELEAQLYKLESEKAALESSIIKI